MQNLSKLTAICGIFGIFLVAIPAKPQNSPPSLPKTAPNTTFNVIRQSGRCPSVVRLWTSFRYYEGGGEHTVIADTAAIAGTPRLIRATKKLVEYRAPLQRAYTSCVGNARSASDDLPYRFQFGGGNVTFRVELPPDTPSTPSAISYRGVVSSRPAVRWAIAD